MLAVEVTLPFSSTKLVVGDTVGLGMVARRENMGTLSSWLPRLASAACTAAAMASVKERGERGGERGGGGGEGVEGDGRGEGEMQRGRIGRWEGKDDERVGWIEGRWS